MKFNYINKVKTWNTENILILHDLTIKNVVKYI